MTSLRPAPEVGAPMHLDGSRRAVDVALKLPPIGRLRVPPRPTAAGRRPERAQLVWRRALELAEPGPQHDRFADALSLLRAAHHDPATMAHALTLGRTHLRARAGDPVACRGAGILEAAIAFLGVKPRRGDLARTPR
jgi:hypothetical protein